MKPFVFIASLVAAVSAMPAGATTYVFSYISTAGVLAGTLEGTLQADNNRIFVQNFTSLTFNGAARAAFPFINNFSAHFFGSTNQSVVSLDGTNMNVIACLDSGCVPDDAFFAFDPFERFGVAYFSSGFGFGEASEAYSAANWSISTVATVPEPASWAMLIAGFGLAGAVQRRRRANVPA